MTITELKDERGTLIEENEAILAKDTPSKEDLDTVKKNQEAIEDFDSRIELLEKQEKQSQKKFAPASFETQKENKDEKNLYSKFSLAKAIRDARRDTTQNGAEAEMIKEGEKEAATSGQDLRGNIHLPSKTFAFGKRDLTIGTEGADVEFDEFGGVIPILRADPVMLSLGAMSMTGLQGDVRFPRHNAAATMAWEGETDAGAETTPTFDNVTLQPKRLGGYTQVSGKFIRQTPFQAEEWVRNELSTALTLALDQASINGATGGDNPVGLLYLTGVNTTGGATNGSALSWANVVNMRKEVAKDNGMDGAYLLNPDVKAKLQQTVRVATTDSRFILDIDGQLAGYPYAESTQVPNDLTKGSGTDLSAIIYGDFSEAMFGQWGVIDLIVDPYSSAKSGLLDIVINGYFDFNVRHATSFCRIVDVITT